MNRYSRIFRRPACRLSFSLALVLALFPACSSAILNAQTQAAPDQLRTLSRDELDLIKVLTRQENAWNKGDLDAFTAAYKNSPDTLFVGNHISHGFSDMLAEYKHDYPNQEAMGSLAFSGLEPRLLDEHFAVVVGQYRLERTKKAGGNAEGAFSMVLEKTKEGWKIVVDHTT